MNSSTFCVGLIAAFAVDSPSLFAQEVGGIVVVTAESEANLMAGDKIVTTVSRGNHLRVDDVSGRAYVLTNGEPRPVGDLLAGICRASGVTPPRFSVPAGLAKAAGSLIERVWAVRPGQDEPPMTRFLAEQLSTAHWFDQTEIRRDLRWRPAVSIDEGLRRLSRA